MWKYLVRCGLLLPVVLLGYTISYSYGQLANCVLPVCHETQEYRSSHAKPCERWDKYVVTTGGTWVTVDEGPYVSATNAVRGQNCPFCSNVCAIPPATTYQQTTGTYGTVLHWCTSYSSTVTAQCFNGLYHP